MRLEQQIFGDLAALCVSPGYIHAFAALCFRDTIVGFADELKPKDMAKMFSASHLIRTELNTLVGLMMRAPIDFTLPPQATISEYIEKSDTLLLEIHQAMMADGATALAGNIATPGFNPFTVASALREAIFYSGESAYTFQYRDFAPAKYAADAKWLEDNRGFNMQPAREVVKAMTDLLNDRLMTALKSLRGTPQDQWTMLPGFTFTASELAAATKLPHELVTKILDAFTAPAGGSNKDFTSLAAFNAAFAFPLIRKGPDECVLFQYYGIAEALYDAPYYWMGADDAYKKKAFEHRGDFTENFSYGRLVAVFGPNRVFKNVEILRGKGKTLGEIDVLVLIGDQAVVVQAKSKKLTLEARNGNDLRLQGDFQAAVQDAVVQAFDYAAFLGDPTVTLKCRDGTVINLPSRPKTIYPVTVVADHYPALAFQARQLVKYTATDQIVAPLVIDVFGLDAITEMLCSPLRLLSYLRLRARFGDVFMMSHEHTLLSYHLKQNLWQGDFDMMFVGDDISSDLDVAMAARRDDVPGAKTPEGILTAFADTPFSRLVAQIEDQAEPVAIALGFFLLELSGDTVKALNRSVTRVLQLVAKDGGMHDMTIGLGQSSSGLTIHGSNLPLKKAEELLYRHCRLRKYSQKAGEWYGVALRPDGSINLAAVLIGPWKFDPAMESAVAEMPGPKAGFGQGKEKVGRNAPCPCGSGKKYKKCHGA
jgi:SEC-C motif-containing protein